MTAPIQIAGFPDTQAIVSGEPDPGQSETRPQDTGTPTTTAPAISKKATGFWLTGAPEAVAKDIEKRWTAQDKGMKSRLARWDLNARRRDGDAYSKLIKDTDQDTFKVYTPRGIEDAPPVMNKTDDLCSKMVAQLTVDPAAPECEPASGSDEDRAAAEFSTRLLESESTESGLNLPALVAEATNLGCTYGSGFVYCYVDPQGGGHRPREVMAPMEATTIGPDGQPVLTMPAPPDPMTGQPAVDPLTGQPSMVPITGPSVIRYVGEDGTTIVDDPADAMLEWLPGLCTDLLTGENIRLLPETADGVRHADGVLVANFSTLGELRGRFPDVQAMSADDQRKLVSFRPEIAKRLLPKFIGSGEGTQTDDERDKGLVASDALCFTITAYRKGSADYPMGAYVVMGGATKLLYRQAWSEQVPSPKTKKMVERAMIIPVAQFPQFRTAKRVKDPYQRGLVELVGDGDPLRAFVIGAVVEYLHRSNNPHIFIPIGSGVQAKSLQLPRGSPIPFNPAGGGKPQQEDVGELSNVFMQFYAMVTKEMEDRSGLEDAARGVASPSVQSGIHAQQIIEQALVSLSGVKQNMDIGYQRLCRIVLQLWRAYYTKPQRVALVGEDGAFKEREWTNADLNATTDVKLRLGSSSMMAPSVKSQLALEKFQSGAITQEDYQRSEAGNLRVLIGMQDDPFKMRVTSQIAAWRDGPPEGWQPFAPPQMAPDPMTGQMMPQPVPPDPANPFADSRAVDQEQTVATIRHTELARAWSGDRFTSKPPAWGQYLATECESMRRAAGIATVAEQQAAQQAAQQQQAQQAQVQADNLHKNTMEKEGAKIEAANTQQQARMEAQAAAKPMSPATMDAPMR